MTNSNGENELEEARRARRRAEKELDKMIAQRPEVKDLAKAAIVLRRQNHFSQLVTLAFRRAAS